LSCLLLVFGAPPVRAEEPSADEQGDRISLAGSWRFRLDPDAQGVDQRWFAAALPEDFVRLPGSTDENRRGQANPPDINEDDTMWYLTRRYEYVGPAWYQREIEIPDDWRKRRIVLHLERCHWETQVWVDGRHAGMQNSLCVPHRYDLTELLTPGQHTLTLMVDNRLKIDVGEHGHSVAEHTQTNWNGVVGRLELRATSPVWVDRVDVYPDVPNRRAKVRLVLGNATSAKVEATVKLDARPVVPAGRAAPGQPGPRARRNTEPVSARCVAGPGETSLELMLPMGSGAALWDEFHPNLHRLVASVEAELASEVLQDEKAVTFGMRDFRAEGNQFFMNGRPTYLRGTLECCIFPLTGYPSMDVASWMRVFRVLKSYGLNHMRFHSWCPPEAAFVAADRSGVMLHVETPMWVDGTISDDPKRVKFIRGEFDRILREYGNHPSFCMFCLGNELGRGDDEFLWELVAQGKKADPRRLYVCATRPSAPKPFDDYYVTHHTSKGWIRGSRRFNLQRPCTQMDYREAIEGIELPVVSHEIGQWTIYPNFDEIEKYTGVLWPRNFELIREDLAAHHMLDLADRFVEATGRFLVILYREEIESALRTPNMAGFQLLDMRDFPGQGTALVGMLDPFWDSKGLIDPKDFRHYCGPAVPLLRMPKRTWRTDEAFTANLDIFNYGPESLGRVTPEWTVRYADGETIASGSLSPASVPTGGLTQSGGLRLGLSKVRAPAKLVVEVRLAGADLQNAWDFWVYPAETETAAPEGFVVAEAWDEAAKQALADGGQVLLLPKLETLGNSRPPSFTSVFWSPLWFRTGAGTMGLLCDPEHPALAEFPTEFHSNWQWWGITTRARALSLEAAPADFRPIVQVIDNFTKNQKLALVFECRVGPGKLLVCTADLNSDLHARPAAAQLRRSLFDYAASQAFAPAAELTPAQLDELLAPPALYRFRGKPPKAARATLDVKAAGRVDELRTSQRWSAEQDLVREKQPGFDYQVRGGTWADKRGAGWHGYRLRVFLDCPKNFTGTLHAHLHDWNGQNRAADLYCDGRWLGELKQYAGEGYWLALPVTKRETRDGKIELAADTTAGPNAQITRIVLIAE
jgi:hypothetical protein